MKSTESGIGPRIEVVNVDETGFLGRHESINPRVGGSGEVMRQFA